MNQSISMPDIISSHKYHTINLPFDIDPEIFIHWLESVDDDFEQDEVYGAQVCGMCEYATLWITKLAYDVDFDPARLMVCFGYYGYGEHYWIMLDNEYFIDLTLNQFRRDAPHLSVTRKDEAIGVTSYNKDYDTQTFIEYINSFN